MLHRRWARVKAGQGQVVLLNGEAGIGKSRILQVVREQTTQDARWAIDARCSPFYQNSAFHPVVDHLGRFIELEREDAATQKFRKLEQALAQLGMAAPESVALLADLLSIPLPEDYPPLNLSPHMQREKTLATLMALVFTVAERQPVWIEFEDVHWADPSTLDLLDTLMTRVATNRVLLLLTYRPEFSPPWPMQGHMLALQLSRLSHSQIADMIVRVAGKALPDEVAQQLLTKSDGVPLYIEEMTKNLVESGLLTEVEGQFALTGPLPQLAIPSTLQESFTARLDRLAQVRELAQIAAVLGREFSYELVQAVSTKNEASVQADLSQLVDAEILYQRGTPPNAAYTFKHALLQDTAYESLLKSQRQEWHGRVARVLEGQFPETAATRPELLAHHYTQAGLAAQAIPYWQQAGQRAVERSAHVEATRQLRRGLEVLTAVSDATLHAELELTLQVTLGTALMATHGYAADEVGQVYTRALTLCPEVGAIPQRFHALGGLWQHALVKGEFARARELGEELLRAADSLGDPFRLLGAHRAIGEACFFTGSFPAARRYLEAGITHYDPITYGSQPLLFGNDPLVFCLSFAAFTLWVLGYPDQAQLRIDEAQSHAQERAHPLSLAGGLMFASWHHTYRRESTLVLKKAKQGIALATEQRFPFWAAALMMYRGWALAAQGQSEEGLADLAQGMADLEATGARNNVNFLTLLADEQQKAGLTAEAAATITRAVERVKSTGQNLHDAELARIHGELLLQESSGAAHGVQRGKEEAETSFHKAMKIARQQEAKSLELRAAMSLARLWQQQGKQEEARDLLAPVYNWFTEGFDTQDLKDAKVLLAELSEGV